MIDSYCVCSEEKVDVVILREELSFVSQARQDYTQDDRISPWDSDAASG